MNNLEDKCDTCKKKRGQHNVITKACPVGKATRIGCIFYHSTNVFQQMRARNQK